MDSKCCSDPTHTNPLFFELGPTWATRYFWARVEDRGAPGLRWPRDFVDFTGRMELNIQTGTTAADFIWNGFMLPSVSSRVVKILEESSITGFTTYRVRIEHRGTEISGYHGLAIKGRGGLNHPSAYAAGFVKGTSIQKVDGLRPTEWDGSDLFTLDDVPGAILATERVRALFKKEKVTNCGLSPALEHSVGLDMD